MLSPNATKRVALIRGGGCDGDGERAGIGSALRVSRRARDDGRPDRETLGPGRRTLRRYRGRAAGDGGLRVGDASIKPSRDCCGHRHRAGDFRRIGDRIRMRLRQGAPAAGGSAQHRQSTARTEPNWNTPRCNAAFRPLSETSLTVGVRAHAIRGSRESRTSACSADSRYVRAWSSASRPSVTSWKPVKISRMPSSSSGRFDDDSIAASGAR